MPQNTSVTRREFINPLEKIEQLLTCPICLDRYRNPKLLPCQHTFCMEPCLDGLVDLVRRSVKCAECRADHPLPYDGIKAFQTNYTLMGFLEIHLQASEENAAELEAYIRRFNMERCKMCNEKSEVEFCPHCEKRICTECRDSHTEMMKRDLNRLMTQVKRISTRISEASSSLTKGIDSLETNIDSVKEEIEDNIKRFVKELYKRQDVLRTELETFAQAEMRLMRTLRDNLDIEMTNINEACEKIEGCLKSETELSTEELVRYKQMFTDGLDYLRLFNPDSEDFAIKKIRFQLSDPQILPPAIAQFGELHVCTTHFNKYQAAAEAFVPRFNALALESDNYKRRSWDPNDSSTWTRRDEEQYEGKRYSDKSSARRSEYESAGGGRYTRSRYEGRDGRGRSGGSQGSSEGKNSMRFHKSPFARVQNINEMTLGASNDSNQDADASSPSASPLPRVRGRPQRQDTDDEELNQRINKIRREYEARQRRSSSQGPTTSRMEEEEDAAAAPEEEPAPEADNEVTEEQAEQPSNSGTETSGGSSDENEEPEPQPRESQPIPIVHYPSPTRAPKTTDPITSAGSSSRDAPTKPASSCDWRKYLIPADSSSTTGADDATERRSRFVRSRTNPDFHSSSIDSAEEATAASRAGKHYESPRSREGTPRRQFRRSDSSSNIIDEDESHRWAYSANATAASSSSNRNDERRPSRYRRKVDRSHSAYAPPEPEDSYQSTSRSGRDRCEINFKAADGHGSKFFRVFTTPKVNYVEKGRSIVCFGAKGSKHGQFNWPRGVAVGSPGNEIVVCDSSNHRIQVFDHRGQFQRSFGAYGTGRGEFDCLAGICVNRYNQFVITDRYNHRAQIFDPNGICIREFGSHGQTNGRFSSPWGVTVDNQGFIYVCDKDNHRVQIFQADGNYVGKFGGIGNREGELQNPHFIASNKNNQLFVSDSSNHRIQVFDHNGHFIFAFGSEGFHEGQFKYPRGIAIDDQGFIIVADSGNNRIQVFNPDGRFHAAFGSWGSGEGQLKQVEGVAVMRDGRIVVSDRENHRIQIF